MRWSSLMSTSAFLFMPIQQSTKKLSAYEETPSY